MSARRSDVTANGLRQAFDASFASASSHADHASADANEDFLMIRVGNDRYAVRLREIAGVLRARDFSDVPATAPAFLGVVGVRGALVPVFGLATILGYDEDPAHRQWMIVIGVEEPLAFAFADFEGYRRLDKSSLHADETAARAYVREVARVDDGACPVISVPLIIATIRNRIGHRPARSNDR